MNEEEKKAITTLKDIKEKRFYTHAFDNGTLVLDDDEIECVETILNLIKKQQKELEKKDRSSISKDKIKKDLEICKKVYEEEMKPYATEYGLNVTYLSKKEKEQLVNKRNCLLTQMKTYEMLLEG